MHALFAGLMGLVMNIGAVFHGGNTIMSPSYQHTVITTTPSQTATQSGGMTNGRIRMKLPQGERRFFGVVMQVTGSILSLQMQRGLGQRFMTTPTGTPASGQTMTIVLDAATVYTGGVQSDITINTKIAGVGKINTDGSLTALQLQINPTIPRRSLRQFPNTQ